MASEQDILQLYNPPRECREDRCDNLLTEFIYFVTFTTVILFLLLLMLAMMFCNSKSCKCKKYSALSTQTNDIQMENYNSIRRASAHLRLMSQNRETPLMGSRTSSMTLDRSQRRPYRTRDSCSSVTDTLQKHQKRTPPVGVDASSRPLPPAYSSLSHDVFLGPEFLQSGMSTSVRYDDSPDHNGSGVQPLLFHRSYDG
uniref:Uncharacterized protein n=1 Tax=Arion vulgaris TaxID=1028688 RepID=A0A0B7A483_9EUPU